MKVETMCAIIGIGAVVMGVASPLAISPPKDPFRIRETSVEQARAICPRPLVTLFEKLHAGQQYVCDDGKNSTVLVFDKDTLIAIMDLKYFAKWEGM